MSSLDVRKLMLSLLTFFPSFFLHCTLASCSFPFLLPKGRKFAAPLSPPRSIRWEPPLSPILFPPISWWRRPRLFIWLAEPSASLYRLSRSSLAPIREGGTRKGKSKKGGCGHRLVGWEAFLGRRRTEGTEFLPYSERLFGGRHAGLVKGTQEQKLFTERHGEAILPTPLKRGAVL